jgi:hypothetical protein
VPPAGLCDSCVHQQLVRTTRGSVFSLCRRSREDPAYPKYPRLPVLACAGYESRHLTEQPRAGDSGRATGAPDSTASSASRSQSALRDGSS